MSHIHYQIEQRPQQSSFNDSCCYRHTTSSYKDRNGTQQSSWQVSSPLMFNCCGVFPFSVMPFSIRMLALVTFWILYSICTYYEVSVLVAGWNWGMLTDIDGLEKLVTLLCEQTFWLQFSSQWIGCWTRLLPLLMHVFRCIVEYTSEFRYLFNIGSFWFVKCNNPFLSVTHISFPIHVVYKEDTHHKQSQLQLWTTYLPTTCINFMEFLECHRLTLNT